MNQLLGGGKKPNSQGSGGLGALAGQFLGGGSSHNQSSHSSSSGGGLVGVLAGQLLGGGKKPEQQQSYSGGQSNQQGHGMMSTLGGMFGGHSSSSV
jgi:hypothetical protein